MVGLRLVRVEGRLLLTEGVHGLELLNKESLPVADLDIIERPRTTDCETLFTDPLSLIAGVFEDAAWDLGRTQLPAHAFQDALAEAARQEPGCIFPEDEAVARWR